MRKRSDFKVGIIVFASILTLVAAYWFLGGLRLRGASYNIQAYFRDVMKLDKGADVRLAGVPIGVVEEIGLDADSKAFVKLLIYKQYNIPTDSFARVTTGGFIGDTYVEIIPGRKLTHLREGDTIKVRKMVQYTEIMENVDKLLAKLQKTADSVNSVLGDEEMTGTLKSTMKNIDKTSAEAAELVAALKDVMKTSGPRIEHIMANLDRASQNAARVGAQVEQLVTRDMKPQVKSILQSAGRMAENLDETILSAKKVMDTAGETKEKLDTVLDRVAAATEQAQQMTAKLNEASAGIRDLATDPQIKADLKKTMENAAELTGGLREITTDVELQKNIKTTMKNAAEVSERAKTLASELDARLKGKTSITPEEQARIPDHGATIYSLWNTGINKARFDANYTFTLGNPRSFYRIGAHNIGENTGLNLQAGDIFGGGASFRYGIHASKVGLGFDKALSSRQWFSADLVDPNNAQLELRTTYAINDMLRAYLGLEDVIHADRRNVIVGVQYKK